MEKGGDAKRHESPTNERRNEGAEADGRRANSDRVKSIVLIVALLGVLSASEARADDPPPHPGAGILNGWKTSHLAEGVLFGLEPTVGRVVVAGVRNETHAGGVVRFAAEYFGRSWYPDEYKLFRLAFNGSIGGGTNGLIGSLAHEAAFGLRLPFGASPGDDGGLSRQPFFVKLSDEEKKNARAIFAPSRHALFARLGYAGSYARGGAALAAFVEVPRLELGYQLDDERGAAGVELRAEAGLALIGRFEALDGARAIGVAPTYGARIIVHGVDAAHVEVGVKRIDERGGSIATPIDIVDSMACLDLGRRLPLVRAVCGNGRFETGDVDRGGAIVRAGVLYGGLLASMSWME